MFFFAIFLYSISSFISPYAFAGARSYDETTDADLYSLPEFADDPIDPHLAAAGAGLLGAAGMGGYTLYALKQRNTELIQKKKLLKEKNDEIVNLQKTKKQAPFTVTDDMKKRYEKQIQDARAEKEKALAEQKQKDLQEREELLKKARNELEAQTAEHEAYKKNFAEELGKTQKNSETAEILYTNTVNQNKDALEAQRLALIEKEKDLNNLKRQVAELTNEKERLQAQSQQKKSALAQQLENQKKRHAGLEKTHQEKSAEWEKIRQDLEKRLKELEGSAESETGSEAEEEVATAMKAVEKPVQQKAPGLLYTIGNLFAPTINLEGMGRMVN